MGVSSCKSDAAWDKRTQRAGLSWILAAPMGEKIIQGTSTQSMVKSPLIAETLALRSGLISAGNMGLSKLRCFSDNETLIRAITTDNQIKEIYGIVRDIHHLSSEFVEVSFSHFSRLLNVEADVFAKHFLSASLYLDPILG